MNEYCAVIYLMPNAKHTNFFHAGEDKNKAIQWCIDKAKEYKRPLSDSQVSHLTNVGELPIGNFPSSSGIPYDITLMVKTVQEWLDGV